MKATKRCLFEVSIVLAFTACACFAQNAPEEAVSKFYSTYLSVHKPGGLPDDNELRQLAPLMSKRLTALIRDALAYQAQYIKEHPPKHLSDNAPPIIYKPPFCDGDFFSSMVEGASSFRVGKAYRRDRDYNVDLHLKYIDLLNPKEKPIEWTDSAIVVKEDNRFVVDDMEFLGVWPYGNHGLLSKILQSRNKEKSE
jgi:hypothetical protein